MHDIPFRGSRTFRWSDGETTEGYDAVELTADGLHWFRWSHLQGEGRIDRGHQSLEEFLSAGPKGTPPPSVLSQLQAAVKALQA